MPRELWKGAIHFGLVHIPVSLYPAEQREELSFTMLDRRDLQPVGYKRYNKTTGKEVAWKDIVKGYEYEKGNYVVLEPEDIKSAASSPWATSASTRPLATRSPSTRS